MCRGALSSSPRPCAAGGPPSAPATDCRVAQIVAEVELPRRVALVLLLVAPAKVRGGWGAGGRVHARWQRADDGPRQLLSQATIALIVHVQIVGRHIK